MITIGQNALLSNKFIHLQSFLFAWSEEQKYNTYLINIV